jgi:hypothetical protein
MMTFKKLGDSVTAEPFRPFRIKMASGQSFDIRHPEMILSGGLPFGSTRQPVTTTMRNGTTYP